MKELKICGITKKYGKKKVLDSFDATLHEGVYALLGVNGAGKSTLMNILSTSIQADGGDIFYNGKNIKEDIASYQRVLGFVPQQQRMFEDFTGREFLAYMATLKEIAKGEISEEVWRVLNLVNLKDVCDRRIHSYSGGMKQRLLIAQAFLGSPQILILDEPTVGLDLEERERFLNYLKDRSSDMIILLSTHIVSDTDKIADVIIRMEPI